MAASINAFPSKGEDLEDAPAPASCSAAARKGRDHNGVGVQGGFAVVIIKLETLHEGAVGHSGCQWTDVLLDVSHQPGYSSAFLARSASSLCIKSYLLPAEHAVVPWALHAEDGSRGRFEPRAQAMPSRIRYLTRV